MSPLDEAGNDWIQSWTIFYWAWWIAWSPFVGMFIARVSKGRTIREFVIGVLLVPTIVGALWFSVFGGTGIHMELFQGANLHEQIQAMGTEAGLFAIVALIEVFIIDPKIKNFLGIPTNSGTDIRMIVILALVVIISFFAGLINKTESDEDTNSGSASSCFILTAAFGLTQISGLTDSLLVLPIRELPDAVGRIIRTAARG